MAQFCHYWRMTPADVDDMPVGMFNVFVDYQNRDLRERNKAATRRRK